MTILEFQCNFYSKFSDAKSCYPPRHNLGSLWCAWSHCSRGRLRWKPRHSKQVLATGLYQFFSVYTYSIQLTSFFAWLALHFMSHYDRTMDPLSSIQELSNSVLGGFNLPKIFAWKCHNYWGEKSGGWYIHNKPQLSVGIAGTHLVVPILYQYCCRCTRFFGRKY